MVVSVSVQTRQQFVPLSGLQNFTLKTTFFKSRTLIQKLYKEVGGFLFQDFVFLLNKTWAFLSNIN